MQELLEELIKKDDRPMALGLASLICLAQRENTSIAYQHDEWTFDDIPSEMIARVDELSESCQLALVSWIGHNFKPEKSPKPGAIAQ